MQIKQLIPLILLILAAAVGYLAGKCGGDSACEFANLLRPYGFSILEPVFLFSLSSIPAGLFLPFVKKSVFNAWLRFAGVWIVISIFLIIQAPEAMNSWFYVFSYVKEDVAQIMGTLFSAISLLMLGFLSYTRRNQKDR
ncbi:MAG TPA: hypothetical protein PK609_03740 [Candidatus Paceibacterota bacterium]|nr:hypothetical protein [Candidatus Paceibacterota bacterium]